MFIACKEAEKYHELVLLALQRNVTISSKTFKPCFKQLSKDRVSEKDSGLDIQDGERQADEIQALKLENTKLKTEIVYLRKLNEDQQEMLDESIEKLKASRRRSEMFENHSSLLASRNHELIEKIHLLEDELMFSNEQLEGAEKKNRDLIKELKDERDIKIINNVQKIEGLEIQVNALKKQVEDHKSTIQEKDDELEASRQLMLQSKSGVLAAQAEDIDKLVNDQLDAKNERLSGVLVKQEDKMAKRKEEDKAKIAKKDQNISDLCEGMSEQNASRGSTKSEAAEKDLQLSAQKQEILALQSVIERKEEEMAKRKEEDESTIAEKDRNIDRYKAERDSLEEEYTLVRDELQKSTVEARNLRRKIARLEREEQWLHCKIDELLTENAEIQTKLIFEKDERKDCHESHEMRMKEGEIKWTNENADLKMDMQSRELDIKALKEEIYDLREMLQERDMEIDDILTKKAQKCRITRFFA